MHAADFALPPGEAVRLANYDPASCAGLDSKSEASELLSENVKRLAKLQDVFAAQTTHALLIVLQGMDAAGKDGIIKHVMRGLNPQGVNVFSFRTPTEEEARHDFLWRETKVLPERGRMAIFNRSYFEEVLIVRVDPSILAARGISPTDDFWAQRYEDINGFERHLTRSGTTILKFFLHLSKEEQRKRLLARLETPDKMWKASDADLVGHAQWDRYAEAYEAMLGQTSTQWAPWYCIPSDRKWVSRSAVGTIVIEALERMNLAYPQPSPERREKYAELARQLASESVSS